MRGLLILVLGALTFLVSLAIVELTVPREEAEAGSALPQQWQPAADRLLDLSSLAIQACGIPAADRGPLHAAYADGVRRYQREVTRVVLSGATRPDALPRSAPAIEILMQRVCRFALAEEPAPVEIAGAWASHGPTLVTTEFADKLAARFGVDNRDGWLTTFLARWARHENTAARNNPLATTQGWPGSTNFNRVGVKNYLTLDDGVDATYKTITNGFYPSVVRHILSRGEAPLNPAELRIWGTVGFARELSQ